MNISTLRRRLVFVSLVGFFVVSLAGCFGQDDASGDPSLSPSPTPTPGWAGSGSAAGSGGEGDGNSPAREPEQAESEQESGSEPAPEPAGLEGAECIYGTWLADNDSALAGMTQFGDQVKSVEGDVYVTYHEDGTFTTDYQNWTIAAEEEGMEISIHRHGVDQGTFTATDTTITQHDQTMGAVVTMTSQAMTMEVPASPASYVDAPYTCTASEMVLTTPDGEGVLTR